MTVYDRIKKRTKPEIKHSVRSSINLLTKDKYLLWLDDQRDPFKTIPESTLTWSQSYFGTELVEKYGIIWCTNYQEFVDCILENGLPEMVSFDNDLGEELEGKDCAKWLFKYITENGFEMPKFAVQSANPICAKEIHAILHDDFIKWKNFQ